MDGLTPPVPRAEPESPAAGPTPGGEPLARPRAGPPLRRETAAEPETGGNVTPSSGEALAARQEALVRALVAGGELPEGFDRVTVGAAGRALLRKRFGEMLHGWPPEMAAHREAFLTWADGRPTRGSRLDGWEFARAHRDVLDRACLAELAVREAQWKWGGEPRARRLPAVRRFPGGVAVAAFGRARILYFPGHA